MFRIIIISLTIVFLSHSNDVGAQKLYLKRASTYMEQFDFQSSIDIYKIVLKKHPENITAMEGLAKAYRLRNEVENAVVWYAKVCESETVEPLQIFYYAQALQANKMYDEAKQQFKRYNQLVPEDKRAPEIIMGLNNLKGLQSENPLFSIDTLNINSAANDFAPVFYKDGIVFSSNRPSRKIERTDVWTGYSFLNVFYASTEDGSQTEELIKGRVPNSIFHDGPVSFNNDQTVMYLTRSNYRNKKANSSEDNTVNLKLYKLQYSHKDQKWGKLEDALSFNSDEYSVGHASVTFDHQYLYFMSNVPGGYGGTDLYRTEWKGTGWGVPENLGPAINTAGMEMFPFVDNKGNLYFSSDGHMGLGGLDTYFAGKTEAGFGRVLHLGTPLNSSRDDFGIVMLSDKTYGYISSDREGGEGEDDIYRIVRSGMIISGVVTDSATGAELPAVSIDMFNIEDNGEVLKSTITDNSGSYVLVGKPEENLNLRAFKDGYFPEYINLNTGFDPLTQNFQLKKRDFIELKLYIADKKTGKPVPYTTVEIINVSDGITDTFKTDQSGKITEKILPDKDFRVIVSKEAENENTKYLTVSKDISTKDYFFERLNEEFELELVKLEVPIVLENIFYNFNKWDIREDAEVELNKLLKILNDNPTMEIELSSHADSRGDDDYNLILTAKRATSVVNWLTEKGIDKNRMIAVGYGETRLVNECSNNVACSEEKHQKNRRTEFTILKF